MMKGNPDYEYKQNNTKEICIDKLYQRELNRPRVNRIVKNWNPYLVNACKVSFRDGKYWVFDGQHTRAALKAKHNGNDCLCECKIFYGLTRVDEAELFVAQNGISSAVGTNARFRALFNTGDKDIVAMNNAVEKAGLVMGFGKSNARNTIVALATLFKSFNELDEKQFIDMLKIIKEAWGGMANSFSSEIISGLSSFYKVYDGEFNRRSLVTRLARRSPVEIVRDGKVTNIGGANRFARVILGIYNSYTTTGRLPEKL